MATEVMQKKHKAYPEYKDSGVKWLGNIPAHWHVKPLKRICTILSGSTPKSGEPDYWNGDIAWATPDDLGSLVGDTLHTTQRMITPDGYVSCGTTLAPAGSLVLSTRAPIGYLAIAGIPLCTNQGCRCLAFREEVQNRFYYYQLLCSKQELSSLGQGATFKELSRDNLSAVYFALPPKDEQCAIVSFLDRETARIDLLIAKREHQIEILQEKRVALISQAVTKGLNPNIPMRDSGIFWLGKVPAHWDVQRSKVIFKEIDDRTDVGTEELLTVSHITGVTPRSEKEVTMFMAESLEGYKRCRAGDLVINTMWAWMGALGTAKQDGIVSPSYNVYRSRSGHLISGYYDRLFRIQHFKEEIRRYSKGIWTSRLRLYPDEFFLIQVPIPPEGEQQAVADFLDREDRHINDFVAKVQDSIEKLREYRTTLISAAVTGRIDVRREAEL